MSRKWRRRLRVRRNKAARYLMQEVRGPSAMAYRRVITEFLVEEGLW